MVNPSYIVEWYPMDGHKLNTDFYLTPEKGLELFGHVAGELSFVHIWATPEEALRNCLKHLPLTSVNIRSI